ncbi:DUF4235 domain-containing protein [Bifidobacterium avesanii]|uniref:DUF4235 domain-containing protein n=1 Tax=Bifidobacterium avesanii TaxID=1798157 RepID=A0A7K3TIX9_9BIFI|nr:DUF4235 domain-containing protein [Bifidobacterium avesanii]KAB8291964.1 hypothetical protein DSM100685_1148 [Bifidobacterium avesanii]NEG79065.1 DUF4235 domain-containing protein [Bifidobacterium avesanii]
MTDYRYDDEPSAADHVVAQLERVNAKVDEMRAKMEQDPDSMGDKILKAALPSVAGLVAGKLFDMAWNRGTAKRFGDVRQESAKGLLLSVAFAALSAAVGAAVATLSTRSSQAIVDRRHRRAHR